MTEEINQTKGQILEQQSAEERTAFAAFKQTFMARVPPPLKPATLNLSGLGFEFWLYLFMAVAAIALAAMRTSDAFYFVGYATSNEKLYAATEAILSVLVVELGMVVFAAILAKKRYDQQERKRREEAELSGARYRRDKSVDVNSLVIGIGLVLMALISMAAGLHQSIRIIENVDQTFVKYLSYGLGVTIGIGITIIAVIAGDIIGQQLAIVTAGFAERAADYEDALEQYQQDIEDAWARSDERRIIRAEVRAAAKTAQSSVSSLSGSLSGLSVNFSSGGDFGNGRRPAIHTERVYQYMDQILQTENRVASFAEVRDVLNLPKSTASKLRNQWLEDRGITEE